MGKLDHCGVRHIVLTILAVVSGVAALAGCGNSDGTTAETQAQSLTKAQFMSKANQICAQGLKAKDNAVHSTLAKLSLHEREHPSKATYEELGRDALLPFYKRISKQLAALSPPAGDEEAVHSVVVKLENGIRKAETDLAGLSRSNPFESAASAAKAHGLEACVF